mmetsp:Transcript_28524/g.60785  ORF Transcript_28524/g.60785 Transcript_28524/m.60785 type:complete len:458 (-) Transcript_28524:185-1558(-)|eukprot:CAMPEP_0172319308 /NCGR_PEP_ID=MMETSP1058-20130122/37320_1 /TAXON_ID=83371 /ORGANISM="Detonula confervacea, Strain CCMP 353" /LENGTH=457 /DNA_ID=CAMNT_0013034319 /DNA_START=35 /DNA_END=1408 /DNA_ORIENTATION=-
MASKAAALQTLTNHGGKRKADDAVDGTSIKKLKLKSHSRTMSVEEAKKYTKGSATKLKAQNKIIRDKQKEIRELKAQIAAVEGVVTKAKAAKKDIETKTVQAKGMLKNDVELILEKVNEAQKSSCNASEKLGRDAMEDMIVLCGGARIIQNSTGYVADTDSTMDDIATGNEGDLFRLAECICGLSNDAMQGAIESLLVAASMQPCGDHKMAAANTLRKLYLPLLNGTVKFQVCYKMWPLVASAMHIGSSVLQDNLGAERYNELHADAISKDYILLSNSVLEMVDKMKKNEYGSYHSNADKDPIIDLLLPTYNAIDREGGGSVEAKLLEIMKKTLLESINEVQPIVDCAMPMEAAIADKKANLTKALKGELMSFLLSSTETKLKMNLSKGGRMEVHRLMDDHMKYDTKLKHESEGYGSDRCLVIRKTNAESPEMVQEKKERKEKYMEILNDLNSQVTG